MEWKIPAKTSNKFESNKEINRVQQMDQASETGNRIGEIEILNEISLIEDTVRTLKKKKLAAEIWAQNHIFIHISLNAFNFLRTFCHC